MEVEDDQNEQELFNMETIRNRQEGLSTFRSLLLATVSFLAGFLFSSSLRHPNVMLVHTVAASDDKLSASGLGVPSKATSR